MSAGEQARAAELRAAFKDGAEWADALTYFTREDERAAEAARRFPDPAEPRVVRDRNGVEWRYIVDDHGSDFEARHHDVMGAWEPRPAVALTNERVQLLADLMAYPFERAGVKQATA